MAKDSVSKPPQNIDWIDPSVHAEIVNTLKGLPAARKEELLSEFKEAFKIATPKVVPSQIQLPEHVQFFLDRFNNDNA